MSELPSTQLRIAVVAPNLPVPHDLARGRYIHATARELAHLAEDELDFGDGVVGEVGGLELGDGHVDPAPGVGG
jgi:hypothetical protein